MKTVLKIYYESNKSSRFFFQNNSLSLEYCGNIKWIRLTEDSMHVYVTKERSY